MGWKMARRHEFVAEIKGVAGGGAFVEVPFDVQAAFGRKRVPVKATFDGAEYRGLVTRMGGPSHILIVLKEIRERIGKQPGDEIRVTIEEDTAPRLLELPTDLVQALDAEPVARAAFDGLSFTHRREYVQWIESAKREQTRTTRIEKAVSMLLAGKKAR
jgi:hypothetical protein